MEEEHHSYLVQDRLSRVNAGMISNDIDPFREGKVASLFIYCDILSVVLLSTY